MNEHRQVLMVQERNGPLRGMGVWKMPTGLVEVGEDVSHAAVREVLEETVRLADAQHMCSNHSKSSGMNMPAKCFKHLMF